MAADTIGTPALWAGFLAFVLALLALDLGVFHRKAHAVSLREAAGWSAVWVALAAVFNAWVYAAHGPARGLEFTTGYLIEKALSVDNIFVFVVIFSYFAVPPALQHRVLFWGILGALVLRGVFVVLGGAFMERFAWSVYVLGAILAISGVKLLVRRHAEPHPERNPVLRLLRRFLPVTHEYDGSRFFVRRGGRVHATPLVLALVTVEATDVVFAVDSVPAIFAVSTDPFIVFTSNIFAILGLRSLYFLLAGVVHKFRFLQVGLALVLVFVGFKLATSPFFHVPVGASLGIVAGLIGGAIAASLLVPKRVADAVPPPPPRAGEPTPTP